MYFISEVLKEFNSVPDHQLLLLDSRAWHLTTLQANPPPIKKILAHNMSAKQEHNLSHLQIYIQLGSKQDSSIAFSKDYSSSQFQSQVILTLKTQNLGLSALLLLWFEIKSQWYIVFSPGMPNYSRVIQKGHTSSWGKKGSCS